MNEIHPKTTLKTKNSLENNIKDLIILSGGISVASFMNEALFSPKYGYYQQKIPIGKNADFITSPEISQTFGELIALYFLNFFILKYPDPDKDFDKKINFVEMGAGNGTLMKDIIISLQKLSKANFAYARHFLQKIQFNIIEVSPALRELQKVNIDKIMTEDINILRWYDNFQLFADENDEAETYFVANELFDCFAINQFVSNLDENGQEIWSEVMVGLDNDHLALFESKFNSTINQMVKKLVYEERLDKKQSKGDIFEHSFEAVIFMEKLTTFIKKNSGLAMIFDYGYTENPFKNTLQAIKDHKKCHIFNDIGNSDITSLVNFSLLQRVVERNDLAPAISSQRDFLLNLGIEERRKTLLKEKNEKQQEEINSGINRLIDEEQMGNLFKVLIFKN